MKGKIKSPFLKLIMLSLFIFIFLFRNDTHSTLNQNYLKSSKKENENENEKEYSNTNSTCDNLDPINLFKKRIDNGPIELCEGEKSKHICYRNDNYYYNDIYAYKGGIICEMKNIVLDPSKSRQSGLSYINGPIDPMYLGFPLITKGFINAECKPKKISLDHNAIYETYLNSWNYEYDSKNEEKELEELAPGKTVFLISRNQDSPNVVQ